MKNSLFLVGALVVGAVSFHVSSAAPAPGPKRPGPSAVQAARLKKSPPPGYLSHYLPDDRYKIAGGVWKYVSTDLDTYYHVPQSPNMMRQPANRVIGFANARDAEEAGYVADPTDGTARRVAPPVASVGGLGITNPTSVEIRYINQALSAMERYGPAENAAFAKLAQALKQNRSQGGGDDALLASLNPVADEYLNVYKGMLSALNRVNPPTRMRRVHSSLRDALIKRVNAAAYFSRAIKTGDQATLSTSLQLLDLSNNALKRFEKEIEKVASTR